MQCLALQLSQVPEKCHQIQCMHLQHIFKGAEQLHLTISRVPHHLSQLPCVYCYFFNSNILIPPLFCKANTGKVGLDKTIKGRRLSANSKKAHTGIFFTFAND